MNANEERAILENLPPDQWVTPEAVADYLSLPKRTVLRFARGTHSSGRRLPCIRLDGKKVRFKVADVLQFIRECYAP